jgi:predicted O-linked N-acetylglucosamine transferase (SPINDLY family)
MTAMVTARASVIAAMELRAALAIPKVLLSRAQARDVAYALLVRVGKLTTRLQENHGSANGGSAVLPCAKAASVDGKASGASRASGSKGAVGLYDVSDEEFWVLLPTTFQLTYLGLPCRRIFEAISRLFVSSFLTLEYVSKHLRAAAEADAVAEAAAASAAAAGEAAAAGSVAVGIKKGPSRVRVGFLSGRFRSHSVARVVRGVMAELPQSHFEVIVFISTRFAGGNAQDEVTESIRKKSTLTVDLPIDIVGARHAVEQQQCDVLIYPDLGEVDSFVYLLAFARLAPVQAKFWGHFTTSGVPAIDYYITADVFAPDHWELASTTGGRVGEKTRGVAGSVAIGQSAEMANGRGGGASSGSSRDALFSEQVVRLAGMSAYLEKETRGSVDTAADALADPALHLHGNLYVCPQHLSKLHPAYDRVLAQIMRQDPNAQLAIVYNKGWRLWQQKLAARLRRSLGFSAFRRVHFFSSLGHDQFQRLLRAAKVALDPFPVGGCVTTLEALVMGTPVVTLPTATITERFTLGMYRRMGLVGQDGAPGAHGRIECVAKDEEEYVAMALKLGTNHGHRAHTSVKVGGCYVPPPPSLPPRLY